MLGSRLKQLRKDKGIGIKTLSQIVHVDRGHLSRIESGKTLPSERLLGVLSRSLGGDLEELSVLAGRFPSDVQAIIGLHPRQVVDHIRNLPKQPPEQSRGVQRDSVRVYTVIDLFAGA